MNAAALYMSAKLLHAGPWPITQFVGLIGVIETGAGLANLSAANLWHLPVQQLHQRSPVDLRSLRQPHWESLGRVAAAVLFLLAALLSEGASPDSILLLPLVLLTAGVLFATSAIASWLGVRWPETDVLQLSLRWRERDHTLPALSLSASILQFLMVVGALPLMRALPRSTLFRPEFAPTTGLLLTMLVLGVVLLAVAALLWLRHVDSGAPDVGRARAKGPKARSA